MSWYPEGGDGTPQPFPFSLRDVIMRMQRMRVQVMDDTVITWTREQGGVDWTTPCYPGWSIVDVYDDPPGHEVRRNGKAVTRTKMFSDSVFYIKENHNGGPAHIPAR